MNTLESNLRAWQHEAALLQARNPSMASDLALKLALRGMDTRLYTLLTPSMDIYEIFNIVCDTWREHDHV